MIERAARLFSGWEEGPVWSCIQGHMGRVLVGSGTGAAALLGDFCFFAGGPCPKLVEQAVRAGARLLVPRDRGWARAVEGALGPGARPFIRYATQKDPSAFDRPRLEGLAAALPPGVELTDIGGALCPRLLAQDWSRDLCGQFRDGADFDRRGIGVAAVADGQVLAGAASYCVFDGGIEVEIDTRPDQRGRGLATACGARLILNCLDRGLYPSWDAHSQISLGLAQKLGYRLDRPYPAYWVEEGCGQSS